MVLKVAIFLNHDNYRMDDGILDELGSDDTAIGDGGDDEDELGGDGLPKAPGEDGEEDGDLEGEV